MSKWIKPVACAASLLFSAQFALADVKLASVFTDQMVLQRDQPVPVWGTADSGEDVTVTFAGQKQTAKAGNDGKWTVKLQPLPANAKEGELLVEGKNKLTLKGVLVGDVWICSGQSNMGFTLSRADKAAEETAAAKHPNIRLFTVSKKTSPKPLDAVVGKWEACSPDTARSFSAVGYFFGRHLHQQLNVPIGLINTSWGGTLCEAWTDSATLRSDPDFAPILDRGEKYASQYPRLQENYEKQLKAYKEKQAAGTAKGNAPRKPAPPDNNPNQPSVLYNAMIAPLQPYAIKGAIWYQGEGNGSRGEQYRKLLPAMIKNWRDTWAQEGTAKEFPFLIVQLANYGKEPPTGAALWPELREAQWLTSQKVPNTGLAVTIDIGNPDDVHPTNKQDVGKRLGLAAEKLVYGRDVVHSGPAFKSMTIEGSKVRLAFDQVAGGLIAKGGKLEGFTLAGEDKKFVSAEATIDGNSVVLSSPQVSKPAAARYGWANSPTCTLFNKEGLPALPFRTDDWPMASAGAK